MKEIIPGKGKKERKEAKSAHKKGGNAEPQKEVSREEMIKRKIEKEVAKPGVVVLPKFESPGAKAAEAPAAIVGEHLRELETYPIIKPYASIRILYDDENHEHTYYVVEPPLSHADQKALNFIENALVDVISVQIESLGTGDAENYLRTKFDEVIFDYNLKMDEEARDKILYYIKRNFLGFGKIDVLMKDPMIEDISCDGPRIPIFLYHRKYESMKSTVIYPTDDELDSFVIKLAQRSNKHVSIAEPILDATLPEGSRLQSTLSKEVSSKGSTFTIRKFRESPFTPPDLVEFNTMSAEMVAFMWLAVQHGSSIMFAGGTASGKTTTLNALSLFIPPQMKIVSIEDTRELNLPHPNWIPGITRSGFGARTKEGVQIGEIDMFTLLKEALRQRPEYIIVGEVRGKEAYVMFQAMATGHTAYGTMHADSVDSVIHRLEGEPINVPRTMLEALDIISVQIQTRVGGKRVRRCKQVIEMVGMDPHTHEMLTNEVFHWVPGKDEFKYSGLSYTLQKIMTEKGMSDEDMVREMERRKQIVEWMRLKKIKNYVDVAKAVSSYYNEPEKAMAIVRDETERIKRGESLEAPAEAMFEKMVEETGKAKPAEQEKAIGKPKQEKPAGVDMKNIRCPRCKTGFTASYGLVTCPNCGFSALLGKPGGAEKEISKPQARIDQPKKG